MVTADKGTVAHGLVWLTYTLPKEIEVFHSILTGYRTTKYALNAPFYFIICGFAASGRSR
jgi:hypothetical protein